MSELRLALIDHTASRLPLYPHQAAMWEEWDKHDTMLLAARTGTGKTRAAMLPPLKRGEWAVAIYPTNELVRDQVRAVAKFAVDEGVRPLVWTPEAWASPDRAERYSEADHVLVPVDGSLLDRWQEAMRCKSRGETLRRLLEPDKPKIVFTNPDILFLSLALRYHAEAFESLRRYGTLIVDEFHLYQGVELAHALAMIAVARSFEIFRRVVLLSATPDAEVRELLEKALHPAMIDPDGPDGGAGRKSWTAVHAVELTPVPIGGRDPVEMVVSRLVDLRPELERLRATAGSDDYVPAVAIVNSVLSAILMEDRLVESGYPREALAIIRGLSHRAIRETRGKLVALGTSAIEVGVDFHCDHLLFEASEAASFLQRFGRVGRHGPGTALALVPPNAFEGLSGLPTEIDRPAFEKRIYAWYPSAAARPWFVTTEYGMVTARALGENLVATVERGGHVTPALVAQVRERVEAALTNHAERLGCRAENVKAKGLFERCAAGKKLARWVATYRDLNRFRTSLPGVKVHDFMEQHRRNRWGLGEYDIDLTTLLKRAVGLAWNDKLGMLTIKAIGKQRRVHASDIFRDEDCGVILETRDYPNLLLYQDGEPTPVSDFMGRENHVFTVVARTAVEDALDWRLPVFECGKHLIAFDGAALLLVELWRRASPTRSL